MGIDEHLQELKEKEIIRLTTPVTRKKINGKPDEIYDCEGNACFAPWGRRGKATHCLHNRQQKRQPP